MPSSTTLLGNSRKSSVRVTSGGSGTGRAQAQFLASSICAVKNREHDGLGIVARRCLARHGLASLLQRTQVICAPGKPWMCWSLPRASIIRVVARQAASASVRDIGRSQQDAARLARHPAAPGSLLGDQRFKPFAFLAATPHNIRRYRNLRAAMTALAHSPSRGRTKARITKSWLPN